MPHIHEKIDFTVEVFVVCGDQVLLRKHDKYKMWLSVGGHIELDEDPNQAAVREVKEETGLDVELVGKVQDFTNERDDYKELMPPQFLNRHKINEAHEHVTLVYFARARSKAIIQGEKEVSDECRWFTVEELDDSKYAIKDSIKHYAKNALLALSR